MQLSQDRLSAFYETARLNSFTKAAKVIGITQSALSHRIRNLENDLRVTLFIRDPSALQLTEAGARLFNYCQVQTRIEGEFIRDLTENHTDDLRGALRIGSVSSLAWSAVVPSVGNLIRKNPLVHLDMLAREVSELPILLKRNRVDFIVIPEKVTDSPLEEHFLGKERYILVESKKKSARDNVYLDHEEGDKFTYEFFEHQGRKVPSLMRSFMDDNHGLIAGVKEGLGRAVIPEHLLKEESGIQIVSGFKPLEKSVYLYFARQPFYTKLQKETVSTLSANIPRLLR